MVALNFNAAGVKPNTALEAIPSGVYPVVITRTEEKPTKAGNGSSYIEVEMQVQGGEYNGRKLFDRLNTKNQNQTAVDIAYATLSAICHVTGVMQLQDTQQLHGRPFQVVVVKKERDDQPGSGNMSNEVKGYKDVNGNDPGFAGNTQGGAPQGQAQGGGQPGWAGQQQQGQVQQQNNGQAPGWAGQQQQGSQQPVQGQVQPPVQGQQGQQGGTPGWAAQGQAAGPAGNGQAPAWAAQ